MGPQHKPYISDNTEITKSLVRYNSTAY